MDSAREKMPYHDVDSNVMLIARRFIKHVEGVYKLNRSIERMIVVSILWI